MKKLVVLAILCIASGAGYAQSGTVVALRSVQDTEFFTEFKELRDRAHTSVKNFKLIQDRYSEMEVSNLKNTYNASADYFNAVLYNIKADMQQRDKRKYMISYPDSYSKQVEADLYRAKEYYANTFQREITELTDGQITGSALVALLPQMLKYAQLVIQMIKEVDKQIKKMNETVLNNYLIEPYRFQKWDEIN